MKDERLSAVDASFLDVEGQGPAIAVGGSIVLEGTAPSTDEIKDFLRSRRDRMQRLFQRLESSTVPVLRRAKWVDADVDLDYHVRSGWVAGDPHGLDGAVAKLMEQPMDRDRPLWTVTAFDDIGEPDAWALVWRIHHTVADGQGVSMLLGQTCDLSPDGPPTLTDAMVQLGRNRAAKDREAADEEERNALEGALRELTASVRRLADMARRLPDTARSYGELVPRTGSELAGEVSAGRSYATVEASLADAKRAGKSLGATVNDVILAAVADSFTALLRAAGVEVAGREIRALMPVTMRPPGNAESNNQVSILPVVLPLGVDDPAERLAAVNRSTQIGKGSLQPLLNDAMMGLVTRFVPNAVQEAATLVYPKVGQYFADTLVTNVPGPQVPLYFMGRAIRAQYPIVPIASPLRFIVAISSFNGKLDISVTSDDEHWADAIALAAGVRSSLARMAEQLPAQA